MSGPASTTVRSDSAFPAKSGTSSSTAAPGELFRSARTAAAKCAAPPSGRSSRVTDVRTTWRQPSSAAARATRSGSAGSGGPGTPGRMPQKAQPRVQQSPSRITVAVPAPQHSPTLGHRASRHTVRRPCRRRTPDTSAALSPEGTRTLSHSGRRAGGVHETHPRRRAQAEETASRTASIGGAHPFTSAIEVASRPLRPQRWIRRK